MRAAPTFKTKKMRYDINCPYCAAPQDIDHDDGYGYEEGKLHQQECGECEKTFVFITSISYSYYPEKAECLNDGKHDYKITQTYPKCCSKMRCSMCDNERELTENERIKHNIGTWDDYLRELKRIPKQTVV